MWSPQVIVGRHGSKARGIALRFAVEGSLRSGPRAARRSVRAANGGKSSGGANIWAAGGRIGRGLLDDPHVGRARRAWTGLDATRSCRRKSPAGRREPERS